MITSGQDEDSTASYCEKRSHIFARRKGPRSCHAHRVSFDQFVVRGLHDQLVRQPSPGPAAASMLEESDTYLMILEQGEERARRGDVLLVGEKRLGAADQSVRDQLASVTRSIVSARRYFAALKKVSRPSKLPRTKLLASWGIQGQPVGVERLRAQIEKECGGSPEDCEFSRKLIALREERRP